jgi:hypothetical protein
MNDITFTWTTAAAAFSSLSAVHILGIAAEFETVM